jgi:hypothetical protein
LVTAVAVGLEAGRFVGGGARDHLQDLLALVEDSQGGVVDFGGDGLAGMWEATCTRWPTTWMPPRHETRRCTRTGPVGGVGGGGAGAVQAG